MVRTAVEKQLIPNKTEYLKQKDLHKISKRMERYPRDFYRHYPNHDAGGKRSYGAEEEYRLEASVVLNKPEEKLLNKDYLILLQWKIKKWQYQYIQ